MLARCAAIRSWSLRHILLTYPSFPALRCLIDHIRNDSEKQTGAFNCLEKHRMVSEDLKEKILRRLGKEPAQFIGNTALIRELGLETHSERYWEARDVLLLEGKIEKGRGRGGSIILLQDIAPAPPPPAAESTLYDPIMTYLAKSWFPERGFRPHEIILAKTASQGRRQTGGHWTRPDITAITVKSFKFLPGKTLQVFTFEVKPDLLNGVDGIYETAAHAAVSHKSHLVIKLQERDNGRPEFDRITNECGRFGIGLITFVDPAKDDSFETVIEASSHTPDPVHIDDFIERQIAPKDKDQLSLLLR
jgi:hypothetical protein